jgi:O-antigen ligase
MHSFGFNLRRWEFWKELISFRFLVIVSPFFLLTVKHWTNLVVLVVFIGALIFLIRKKEFAVQDTYDIKSWRWIIALTLVGPLLAVGIAQMLRGEFYPPNFDAPLRIAFCAPVFWAVSLGWLYKQGKESITFLWMKFCFPLTLLWTFIYRPSWSTNWGNHVITTYFVDNLSFGSLTLLFALLSFIALTFFWSRLSLLSRLISIAGVLIGLYLSVKSGSRTGWINMPVCLFIWALGFSLPNYGRLKTLCLLVLMLVTSVIIIYSSPHFTGKVLATISEISNYDWGSNQTEGSVAVRISFYRMAIFYFLNNPIKGWGDLGWIELMNSPEIVRYGSEYARSFPKHGFHNEILTSSVRSGIWGLLSSIAFFLFPIIWAVKILRQPINNKLRIYGFFILFLTLHMLLAGMTTEVTNLVFLGSFLGLTFSLFIGESINHLSALNHDDLHTFAASRARSK